MFVRKRNKNFFHDFPSLTIIQKDDGMFLSNGETREFRIKRYSCRLAEK